MQKNNNNDGNNISCYLLSIRIIAWDWDDCQIFLSRNLGIETFYVIPEGHFLEY